MFKLIGEVTNLETGKALPGARVRILDGVNDVPLYQDENMTPYPGLLMSGIDGSYEVWVEDGTYDVVFYYEGDALKTLTDVPMYSPGTGPQGVQGVQGPPGPAGNVAAELADLQQAPASNKMYFFNGDLYQIEDANGRVPTADNAIVSSPDVGKLWVRQTGSFKLPGEGPVSRTLVDKALESISVKDFGAVGDGVTDDTAAIQAAIAYGATNKRAVKFPFGTYIVDPRGANSIAATWPAVAPHDMRYAFEIQDDMHLFSDEGAVIKTKSNVTSVGNSRWYAIFASNATRSNISFRGLVFDGNAANNPLDSTKRRNQAFIGFFGIGGSGNDVVVEKCVFTQNPGENSVICNVASTGFATTTGKRWDFIGCHFLDNGLSASDYTSIFGYADDVSVTDCLFEQTVAPTDYTVGAGRTAYEVHGSRALFSKNTVRNYFCGVIVNSRWVEPVLGVIISDNFFSDMFSCGVRLWRMESGANVQSALSGIKIDSNIITLSPALYSTAATIKAGILAFSNFNRAIDDLEISNNQITQVGVPESISGGIYIQTQSGSVAQKSKGWRVRDNVVMGTYYGVYVWSVPGNASVGDISIRSNRVKNLQNVGANVNPIGIAVRGQSVIDFADVQNNSVENDGVQSGGFAYNFSDNITRLRQANNTHRNVTTTYSDTAVTTIREGDSNKQVMPTATGVTVQNWATNTGKGYAIRLPKEAFSAAALTKDVTALTLPAKTRLLSIVADVTEAFAGSGITSVTARVGTGANSNVLLVDFSGAVVAQKGLVDADLGTVINRAGAVQGGAILSWTGNGVVNIRLTAVGANLDQLTAGAVVLYLTTEAMA